jgi:hypothetical protein
MKDENMRTDNREIKRGTGASTSDEMNRNVKNDTTNKEMKRDMNVNTKRDTSVNTNDETNKNTKNDTINSKDAVAGIEDRKDAKSGIKDISSQELDSFVHKVHYPAKKQEIIDAAKRDGSSDKITYALQMIKEKYYSSADELAHEITAFA